MAHGDFISFGLWAKGARVTVEGEQGLGGITRWLLKLC